MEKDELRKKYLDIRKNILNKEAKSQIIIEKVIQSDEYQKAQVQNDSFNIRCFKKEEKSLFT